MKAAVEAQASHAKKEIMTLVEKYKPRILEELKKFKTVVIEEGKGLVIEMLGDAIKIIIKGGIENNDEESGFKDRMLRTFSLLSFAHILLNVWPGILHPIAPTDMQDL